MFLGCSVCDRLGLLPKWNQRGFWRQLENSCFSNKHHLSGHFRKKTKLARADVQQKDVRFPVIHKPLRASDRNTLAQQNGPKQMKTQMSKHHSANRLEQFNKRLEWTFHLDINHPVRARALAQTQLHQTRLADQWWRSKSLGLFSWTFDFYTLTTYQRKDSSIFCLALTTREHLCWLQFHLFLVPSRSIHTRNPNPDIWWHVKPKY